VQVCAARARPDAEREPPGGRNNGRPILLRCERVVIGERRTLKVPGSIWTVNDCVKTLCATRLQKGAHLVMVRRRLVGWAFKILLIT